MIGVCFKGGFSHNVCHTGSISEDLNVLKLVEQMIFKTFYAGLWLVKIKLFHMIHKLTEWERSFALIHIVS